MIFYSTLILWNIIYANIVCNINEDLTCDPSRHVMIELSIIFLVALNIASFAWSNIPSGTPDYNVELFNYDDIDLRSRTNAFILFYGIFSSILAIVPFIVILIMEDQYGLHFKDGSLMILLMITSIVHSTKQFVGTTLCYVWTQEYHRDKMISKLSQC